MNTQKMLARKAGWLYVAMAVTGVVGIMYVPSQLIVASDASATAVNISVNPVLHRFGIVSQLACQVIFIYLVLALDRLLRPVSEKLASQMKALVIVAVPIAFLNMLNLLAPLILFSQAAFLTSFTQEQLQSLGMLFIELYSEGVVVVQIFWGLWLIPFGQLVYLSRFIPKIFGLLLIAGGIGYVVASLAALLLPGNSEMIGTVATIPSAIGEFSIIFYFLIKGVREHTSEAL